VYGEEPSAAVGRMGPGAKPPWADGDVNGEPTGLGAPRYASNGGLVVSAEPSWLSAPSVAPLPAAQQVSSDVSAHSELTSQLPGFFAAFADDDQVGLGRYLASAAVGGLGGAASFGVITALRGPQGGSARDIRVTVSGTPGEAGAVGSRLAANYDMVVVDPQSGRWYVKDIRASTQSMGTQ
jgi:hypothetical protein